jgi:hypothetical protein
MVTSEDGTMSSHLTLQGKRLSTGGFLTVSMLGDVATLAVLGYFAVHAIRRSAELLTGNGASPVNWVPVVLGGIMLLVLIPLVTGRLWSQISTRYTTDGVSQWRFLSYRALAWSDIVHVYYDGQSLFLEGETSAVRILAKFYRRPEQLLRILHLHLTGVSVQEKRNLLVSAKRPGAGELRPGGARANVA